MSLFPDLFRIPFSGSSEVRLTWLDNAKSEAGYSSLDDLIWRTTAHEVGHQFDLEDDANRGLMGAAEGPSASTQHFVAADLDLIRRHIASPGR